MPVHPSRAIGESLKKEDAQLSVISTTDCRDARVVKYTIVLVLSFVLLQNHRRRERENSTASQTHVTVHVHITNFGRLRAVIRSIVEATGTKRGGRVSADIGLVQRNGTVFREDCRVTFRDTKPVEVNLAKD